MNNSLRAAVELWAAGQRLLPALSAERRTELEASVPPSMIEDISCLYSMCDGMPDGETDNNLFCLWPLEACVRESKGWPEVSFPFADGFLSAHIYFLESNRSGSYQVCATYGEGRPMVLASSLDEFFRLLVQSPQALLLPV